MIDEEIFEKYSNWKNACGKPQDITPEVYVSFNLHPEDALLLCHVLFGSFMEKDGYVFLESHFDQENFEAWCAKGLSLLEIQKVLNHVHIYDLFANCTDEVKDVVFEGIAKQMQSFWEFKLAKQFPGMDFVVQVSNSDQDYGPTVVFYQVVEKP